MQRSRQRSRAAFAVGLGALLLAGCGAGGGSDHLMLSDATLVALHVSSGPLPAARASRAYGPVQLTADGSPGGALTWRVWDGRLPEGLTLDPAGRLAGVPARAGVTIFSVHVTDGRLAGTATLAVAVDALALYAHAGLSQGEAWTDVPVTLHASGQQGAVSFEVASSGSGGTLTGVDGARGTATWRPGGGARPAAHDVLRATDLATGRRAELDLVVREDPTGSHVAEFGRSDVWYVNTTRKLGAHPYASDMHAALADIGFRAPESFDMVGTPADGLAETWIRLEMLRQLNRYYLREADGSAGGSGLPVSFPFREPGAPYQKPEIGAWATGAPHNFSEVSLLEGRGDGVVGTAFIDDGANTFHENNTTSSVEELGVFLDVVTHYWNAVYSHGALRDDPIRAEDADALHALLHGLPSPGGRYEMLRDAGRDFGRVLAIVVAHEVGHSLGLGHSRYQVPDNSIMSASAAIGPWSEPSFLPEDVASLRARLPGPGRYGAALLSKHATPLPAGGIGSCDGRSCNLRLRWPRPAPRGPAPQRR